MLFLLSHIWLPYLLALVLILIAFFFRLGGPEVLLYAAALNLVPVLKMVFFCQTINQYYAEHIILVCRKACLQCFHMKKQN